MRSIILSIIVILALSLMVSCSGGGGTVTTPDNGGNKSVAEAGNGTAVAGLWQLVADRSSGSIDIVQLRTADKMLNVIGFMEPPPLVLMDLDWPALVIDFVAGTIHVGVKLTHPLGADPDATFTGFDVRGVCFGPEVVNADGLTIVMSPEFFSGEIFGYQDGLLGAPDSVANYSGWAGYKYYCDGIGPDDDLATFMGVQANVDNRGKFTGTTPHQRNFDLKWADPADILIFNYAIYANYDWPVGTAPFTLDEFPITTANSAEAFCLKATETANSLWSSGGVGGGALTLDIEVWDWLGDISDVTIESVTPGVIASTPFSTADGPGSTSASWLYSFDNVAGSPTTTGDLDILITVTDAKTFGQAWFMDLLTTANTLHDTPVYAAWETSANVIDCPIPTVEGTYMGAGIITGKVITCTNLIAGASLGVKLTDGTTDWVGTAVTYIDGTHLSANFDLNTPPVTPGALLDIVVTNGCSTQGTGVDLWEALYWVHSVGTTNVDVIGSNGPPDDIGCNPATGQVAISYHPAAPPNTWRIWTANYTASTSYNTHTSNLILGYRRNRFIDGCSWGTMLGENTFTCGVTAISPVWGWDDWTGAAFASNWWFGGCYTGALDVANLQANNSAVDLYDLASSYFYIIQSASYGAYSISYAWGAPMYGGSGTAGVISANVRGMDFDTTASLNAYILEQNGATAGVEKWGLTTGTYGGVSFGSSQLVTGLDITVDAAGNIYVLDKDASNVARIWVYNSTGALIGKSGQIGTSDISGIPLRMDAAVFATPDEVHVLSSTGLTRFSIY